MRIGEMVDRIRQFLKRIFEREKAVYWSGFAGILAMEAPFIVSAGLALASGLGQLADAILFFAILLLIIFAGQYILAGIFTAFRLKIPRVFIGGAVSASAALILIFHEGKFDYYGATALAALILFIGYFLGTSLYLLLKKSDTARGPRIAYALVSVLLAAAFFGWLFDLIPFREPAYRAFALPESSAFELQAEDPSKMGEYAVKSFTYGSGTDRARARFGKDAAIITPTVDASAIIDDWDWSRKWLWGYEIDGLPLNGQVWMPEGEGPFPLVLIVHGNHSMADYSDKGYGYLGELLASRGFISISVDENFLNHSTWEGGLDSLSANMTIRAWMLLQHLAAIEQLAGSDGNAFSGKVDMDRIALIGHSRGGQASVLAAGFDSYFSDEKYNHFRVNRDFDIDAVIGVAPTDMLVYDRNVEVDNLNYLLLQGSSDSDVNTFAGDRQYKRIDYNDGISRFKSSLYIRGANHGQFNTDWNRRDISLPTQLFLNKRDLLDGEDQRQIAKVYVTSFLETVLHGDQRYQPIFQDYRYALKWLPETEYVSRYMDSNFNTVTDAEEDWSKERGRKGVAIGGEGWTEWKEEDLKNRRNFSQLNKVIKLSWEGDRSAYTLRFPEARILRDWYSPKALSFSVGNLASDQTSSHLAISVELTSINGAKASLKLDRFVPVPAAVETTYLKSKYLEPRIREGGLSTTAEPVLQSYVLPIEQFTVIEGDAFDPNGIQEIRIQFDQSGGGNVMLDEIGLYLSPRS